MYTSSAAHFSAYVHVQGTEVLLSQLGRLFFDITLTSDPNDQNRYTLFGEKA